MKIFVIYRNTYKDSDYKNFLKAVDNLKRLGHNIAEDKEFRSILKENDKKSYEKYQARIDKEIRDTDIVLVDTTNADAKVGFDIAKSISEKKVVIAVHEKDANTPIIPMQGINAKNLLTKAYTQNNIVDVVKEAVDEAKSKLDTKFILIISPEIDRYLDWASQTKRMHKAQLVRNAIENMAKRDREYRNFLKG
jgi:hypothetical protein